MKKWFVFLLVILAYCSNTSSNFPDEVSRSFQQMLTYQHAWLNQYRGLLVQTEIALRFDTVYIVPDSIVNSIEAYRLKWKDHVKRLGQLRNDFASSLSRSQLELLDTLQQVYFSQIFPEVDKLTCRKINSRDFSIILHRARTVDKAIVHVKQILCQ